MRGANGIAAHTFQKLQPSFPNLIGHCCSDRAGFVMQTDAAQFHLPAV